MSSSTLKITGFGTAYPPNLVPTEDLEKLAYKRHKPSPPLDKVLAINRRTGIKTRSLIYLPQGLALALSASRSAITKAGLAVDAFTHVVATTCTNFSNLGAVGCAGGLASLRLAASLCQAAAWRGQPAHVLVVACKITSSMRLDELERISRHQQVRIAITLFSDGASALILSLDPGASDATRNSSKGIYELVNWRHITIPDTYSDLRLDVDASMTSDSTVHPLLHDILFKTLPNKSAFSTLPSDPKCFDWAVHPGGAAILSAIQDVMLLDREHMKANWEVYENHGNTSSVTVLSILDTLRRGPGREFVMSAAFGPGVSAEGCLLRRM
ncbi:type Iii polyketide Synthase [Mycena vulgaris]|nr:type Iii polyketide Synthase [Mycena vulgaris]